MNHFSRKPSMRNDLWLEHVSRWPIVGLSAVKVLLAVGIGINQQPMFELQVPT
jgi:hypothetical protein